jgi:hypothetical protein
MQDKLIRFVSVLFFGLVIFMVFGLIGVKTGETGVTFWLGLILFLLIIAAQFTSSMSKSIGKGQSEVVREFFVENRNAMVGGMIVVGVLLAIVLTVLMALRSA